MEHKTRSWGSHARIWLLRGGRCAVAVGVTAALLLIGPARWQASATSGVDSQGGDIMIADQFNNRVIVVDPLTHLIVWHFGDGSVVPGPTSVVAPNDAERVGQFTLISGTGAPAGAEPGCNSGCADNRVFIVNGVGKIVWQYGQAGVTGSGPNELNTPVAATLLPNSDVLITDQGNQRVIEITMSGHIVWQYGTTGVAGNGANQLNNPNSAELLSNGDVLIADESNNRVIEVTHSSTPTIVWQYGSGDPNVTTPLNGVAFASRLPNGDTLITSSNDNHIVEVNAAKTIVWGYYTNLRAGSVAAPLPTRAVRLADGDTLISDQFNGQVIVVNVSKQVVFAQGKIGVNGGGFNRLNAPYDAKRIGDFTGLTPPPSTSASAALQALDQ